MRNELENVCLLCGKQMIDRTGSLNMSNNGGNDFKIRHKEHIIQNAIGGRLKSDTILCESCGSDLNVAIDVDFLNILSSFTEKMKPVINKERNGKSKNRINGLHIPSNQKILYTHNKVIPKKPDHKICDRLKTITLYARVEAMKGFRKAKIKELITKNSDYENYKIQEVTEFDYDDLVSLNFSEGVSDFNQKWSLGFIKIATEFAYLNGVSRVDLVRTLDLQNNKLIDTGNVFPYFPIGVFDLAYENSRHLIEDTFPSHTLILFTSANETGTFSLFCYVELFSTFQFYVLLNDNYGSEIHEIYSQKATKNEKTELNIETYDYKELISLASDLEINPSEFTIDQIDEFRHQLILAFENKQSNYKVDKGATLEKYISILSKNIAMRDCNKIDSTNTFSELLPAKYILEFDEETTICLLLESKEYLNDEGSINIKRYRTKFVESDGGHGYKTMSTPIEIMKCLKRYDAHIRQYCHYKFDIFAKYTNELL
ncbi:MAG: hypothetical protein BGO31_12820 [Bacteroidetes bacterium 43-16]|nr:MAG: hypothetical protein BGO31_12820 [Bacteroidetes bacterium 43-16]